MGRGQVLGLAGHIVVYLPGLANLPTFDISHLLCHAPAPLGEKGGCTLGAGALV